MVYPSILVRWLDCLELHQILRDNTASSQLIAIYFIPGKSFFNQSLKILFIAIAEEKNFAYDMVRAVEHLKLPEKHS
jgi:hypothetical protein